jgi:hypothetical protein
MRTSAAAALLALSVAPAMADSLSDLTRNGDACFRRDYDAVHLKRIPRQQTGTMTVWVTNSKALRNGNVGLALTRRSDPQPLFLAADCRWDHFKNPPDWMPSFKKKAGAGCVTSAVPDVFTNASSAEEGGAVVLDVAPDGKTMTVHLADEQVMVKRAARGRKIELKLGRDDRVFLLRRAAVKVCDFLKEALTTLEPGPELTIR